MEYIGIIPARYASTRFPGKNLCVINGKTMIEWVYQSTCAWGRWKSVYVATDDHRIRDVCKDLQIPWIMTKESHTDCLDRAAEAAEILEDKNTGADRYVIVQGDEPAFDSNTLNVDLSPPVVNFYTHVHVKEEEYEANSVKVVVSEGQKALYFSRYSLPYRDKKTRRTNEEAKVYKQLGVYSFSGTMLKVYSALGPSPLENLEGIGMNRLLENDIDVHMRYAPYDSLSVDTEEDRKRVEQHMQEKKQKPQPMPDDGLYESWD